MEDAERHGTIPRLNGWEGERSQMAIDKGITESHFLKFRRADRCRDSRGRCDAVDGDNRCGDRVSWHMAWEDLGSRAQWSTACIAHAKIVANE